MQSDRHSIAPTLPCQIGRGRTSLILSMESIKEKGKGRKAQELSQSYPDTQLTMAVLLAWALLAISAVSSSSILPRASKDPLTACPGYKASNIKTSSSTLTADLTLAGPACNIYGDDLKSLTLQVVYETSKC